MYKYTVIRTIQYNNSIAWYKLQLVYPSSTFTCNFNIANRNRTGRFFPLRSTFVIRLPVEINHHYVSRARKEGTFGASVAPTGWDYGPIPCADQWWLFSGGWRAVCNYILALALDLQLWVPLPHQCPCRRPRAPLPCNHGIYARDALGTLTPETFQTFLLSPYRALSPWTNQVCWVWAWKYPALTRWSLQINWWKHAGYEKCCRILKKHGYRNKLIKQG